MKIFTDAERIAGRERAAKRRKEALALPLIRDFFDDGYWQYLAKIYWVKLPTWTFPPTPGKMRKWLKKLNIEVSEYNRVFGFAKLGEFVTLNPKWPFRAWCGLVLEYVRERDLVEERFRARNAQKPTSDELR